MGDAAFISVFKVLVELEHLGRGDVGLLGALAVVVVDGGENGAFGHRLCAQPVIQNVAHVVGRGALALRAGDANARELVRHMVIKELTEHDEGIANVADKKTGRVHVVLFLRNVGDRAARERVVQVRFLKVRALADEKRVLAQRARIVGEAVDLARGEFVAHGAFDQNACLAQRIGIFSQCVNGIHK